MKRILVLACLAAAAAPAAAQQCTIEYQRADNMLSAPGRPDGNLGKETLTMQAGQTRVFNTDWKYEKQRNDGQNYYGSHLRIIRNTGQRPVNLTLRGAQGGLGGMITSVTGERALGGLQPGQSANDVRADLMEVSCPPADKEARAPGPTPGGTANPPATLPPGGLAARQVSPTEVLLTWAPVPNAKEYRVYVSPPPQPNMAGKPGVVGASGTRYIIPIPRNLPPSTVFNASIETVDNNGSVSQRAQFNPVPVQLAGGPSGPGGGPATGGGPASGPGTSPSTPATSGAAGQQCPPGQFVTGFSSTGAVICASPR